MVGVRRALAGSAAGLVVLLGTPVAEALADTPTPTPTAVVATATPSATGSAAPVDNSVPSADNSSLIRALGGAAAVAVLAAAVVFVRRR